MVKILIYIFFCFSGSQSLDWDKESLKRLYSIRRGGGRGRGASRTWNSLECLPSKYYPGPMLLKFSDRMGTGVSNMVNSLTLIYFMLLIFSTLVLIRHLWQFKTVVFMHRCLICALLLRRKFDSAKNRREVTDTNNWKSYELINLSFSFWKKRKSGKSAI